METPVRLAQERTLHVISHTHWDREWYLTFQQFRYRLVRLIDRLMDLLDADPEFRVFHLDAQTIVLEDYLEIKPQNRHRLEEFIRSGRILIGPWYQLNDEFLVSGESTIRSLLIGHRIAREFGGTSGVMKVGYLPDQFGNISQMPQIFRGFGIPYAVVGRGRCMKPGRKMEFQWESPDGSRVLTSFLAFWYNNFERIPDDIDQAIERVNDLEYTYMGPVAASRHLLFMNGVDHFEAQQNLSAMIQEVNDARMGSRLVHSTLPAYFQGVDAEDLSLDVECGELRSGPSQGGLAGTLSSRVNLKQANARCQSLLERYVEPLASAAWTLGAEYPQDMLTYAWKLLMQNHPHDSICGCSQDQVHREMETRFEQVEQVSEEIIAEAFGVTASRMPQPAAVDLPGRQTTFTVFNPLGFTRTDLVEVVLDFPLGKPGRDKGAMNESLDVEHLAVFDNAGQRVPCHVSRSEIAQTRVLSPTVLPMAQMHRRFTVQLRAENVPPIGFKAYRAVAWSGGQITGEAGSVVGAHSTVREGTLLVPRMDTLDNGLLEVFAYVDGTFKVSLPDEEGDYNRDDYITVNVLEDGGDVGDEYVYRAPRRDAVFSTDGLAGQCELIEDSPFAASIRMRGRMQVPVSATPDREARSEERVELPFETIVRLQAGKPYVEVKTTVHNTARDHRLRARFPLSVEVDKSAAQTPFDVVERPRVPMEHLSVVAAQHPHQEWVSIHAADTQGDPFRPAGLTVFTPGLYEHELVRDDVGTLAVTLLRSVDRMTRQERDPLGHDRCPDAQCPGEHVFHYAVMPHQGTWDEEQVWEHAQAFATPLRAFQTPSLERSNPDHNAVEASGNLSETPASLLTLDPPELVLSAFKRTHDRNSQIVRFWNIGKHTVNGRIALPGATHVWKTNLDEEREAEIPLGPFGTVVLDVSPKQIVTLEFTRE